MEDQQRILKICLIKSLHIHIEWSDPTAFGNPTQSQRLVSNFVTRHTQNMSMQNNTRSSTYDTKLPISETSLKLLRLLLLIRLLISTLCRFHNAILSLFTHFGMARDVGGLWMSSTLLGILVRKNDH
jgi:hypothetical protein